MSVVTVAGPRPLAAPIRAFAPAGMPRQFACFIAVGAATTVVNLSLYALLRSPVGVQAANVTAALVATVLGTAVNRRFTFGATAWRGALRAQVEGLGMFALGTPLTSTALAGLHLISAGAGRDAEILTILVVNGACGLTRFLRLRLTTHR